MQTNSRPQADGSGYAAGPVTKAPNWHGLVVYDVLFNNLATGLFLAAALGELAAPQACAAVAQVAYPVALVFLLIDLTLLVFDLGDPLRFHHMLRLFKPSSPMSLGVWSLTVFSLPLTVIVALDLLLPGDIVLTWLHTILLVLGLLPALGSAVYKGVLFSTSAQPGWREARWLGGYLTSSALLLGCAMMLLLSILMGQESAVTILHPAVVLLLLLTLIPLGLLLADVRAPLAHISTHKHLRLIGVLALVGGVLIPLVLLLVGVTSLWLVAVLFLLLGSFASRYVIVMIPHAA